MKIVEEAEKIQLKLLRRILAKLFSMRNIYSKIWYTFNRSHKSDNTKWKKKTELRSQNILVKCNIY